MSNRDPSVGSSCLAERRMLEVLAKGTPSTEFLRFGDSVEIDMCGPDGGSLFGAIRQEVRLHAPA